MTDGLTTTTYNQCTTLGPRSHVAPQALLQAHIKFWAFFTLTSTCSFQVSRESRITPRYLTDMECCKVFPNKRGSTNPGRFLLLVKATSPVLSALSHKLSSPHHISTIFRAHCMSPDRDGHKYAFYFCAQSLFRSENRGGPYIKRPQMLSDFNHQYKGSHISSLTPKQYKIS